MEESSRYCSYNSSVTDVRFTNPDALRRRKGYQMSPDQITAVYEQQDKARKDAARTHLRAAIQKFKAVGRRREFKAAMVAIGKRSRAETL